VDKLSTVVSVERERDGGLQITETGPARVELRGVEDGRVAGAVSTIIAPGETVAVTGGPATGKSTLLQLLLGRCTPSEGSVVVDGVDLEEADLRHFRMSVCHLDAEARMPAMTVAEYLRLHAPDASTSALREALTRVGLEAAVEALPQGLDTRMLPRGPLSRTQRLRLSVARLLLQQPRLALIDGACDELATEPAVLDAVFEGPWTTIVTTSSEAIMARAARTLHLAASL
jgi:ABC-type bacteriocin/lantibiotic exporter with double-glycine peptidase domain